jgi:hypothetical protein
MGLLVDFTVLVPYASTDPQRDAARQFVVEWLAPLGWPIVVADGDPDRPWSKGAALAATVGSVDTPGLVIHDADVIVEHAALTSCAQAVVAGHAWAQPHRDVYRLSRRATHMVLARQMFGPHHFLAGTALERRPHAGPPGGGIVVCPGRRTTRSAGSTRGSSVGEAKTSRSLVRSTRSSDRRSGSPRPCGICGTRRNRWSSHVEGARRRNGSRRAILTPWATWNGCGKS